MVPFAVFLNSTDPRLYFCGFYSHVAPILKAGEFFGNRTRVVKSGHFGVILVVRRGMVTGRKIENRDFDSK